MINPFSTDSKQQMDTIAQRLNTLLANHRALLIEHALLDEVTLVARWAQRICFGSHSAALNLQRQGLQALEQVRQRVEKALVEAAFSDRSERQKQQLMQVHTTLLELVDDLESRMPSYQRSRHEQQELFS